MEGNFHETERIGRGIGAASAAGHSLVGSRHEAGCGRSGSRHVAGARPYEPPIDGLAEAGFLTDETVFTLTRRPRRLAVLGAGPLGCELAQASSRLGSSVTIIEHMEQFLAREDVDAAEILARQFTREGIEVRLGAQVVRVAVSGGAKTLHLKRGGEEEALVVDEILVGAGRRPNVENLGLEAAGVAYDARSGVKVDDRLRTTNRRIYAAGDVCLRYKFTHTADAAARIVIQNALFRGRKKLSALTVPCCTYTDPELAHVGISQKQAEEGGIEIETFTRHFSDVDRAIAEGEEEGFVKVHVRKGTDKILGATIVARHAGEMISEITLAMVARAAGARVEICRPGRGRPPGGRGA